MSAKPKSKPVPPEPMAMMLNRIELIDAMPPHREPKFHPDMVRVALEYGRLNASDPFAAQRMYMLLRRGLERRDEIAKDNRAAARRSHVYGT